MRISKKFPLLCSMRRRKCSQFALFIVAVLIGSIVTYIVLSRQSQLQISEVEVIDQACNNDTGVCFEIVDRSLHPPSYEEGTDEIVQRTLDRVTKNGSRIPESTAYLIPYREFARFGNSDTRLWKVYKGQLAHQYTKGMILGAFLSRVINFKQRRQHKKVLCIGLGGGTMISYLKTLIDGLEITAVEASEDVADMAEKWFDVRGIVVAVREGLEWLKTRNENDTKYDLVFIDACTDDPVQQCPPIPLTHPSNIHFLMKRFRKDGRAAVIFNFVVVGDRFAILTKHLEHLLTVFSSCFTLTFILDSNVVVVCTTHPMMFFDTKHPEDSLWDALMGMAELYDEADDQYEYGQSFIREIAAHALIKGKLFSASKYLDETEPHHS